MEIQDLHDLYKKLKSKQISITENFLYQNISKHKLLLDVSNKYIFEQSIPKLKRLIKKSYSSVIPLKSLTLQNCMLSAATANTLLLIFLNFSGKICLTSLDIGNNSIVLSTTLALTICKVFEKSGKNDWKSLKLQGNVISEPEALSQLLTCACPFSHLNLYDCYMQPQCLQVLSECLSQNKKVSKLDLSYNPEAFVSKNYTSSLGIALGVNTIMTSLKLSGNSSLSRKSLLEKLCIGLKHSNSIEKLVVSNISFSDFGLKILRKRCLNSTHIETLDLQNNQISCKGFIKLIRGFPSGITKLVVSYNNFEDNTVLLELGKMLQTQRFLRTLIISYCFALNSLDEVCMEAFCKGVTENRSLTDLVIEGCKIGDDPDYFCQLLSDAIEARKYPITFRISAVKLRDRNESKYLSKTHERILQGLL